jgi:putative inorganic carbon (HCO3(-)) transporter
MLNSSIIINAIKKLNMSDDTFGNTIQDSFFCRKISFIIDTIRNKLNPIAEKSFLLSHIDDIIFGVIILLLTATLFAGTGIMGLLALAAFFLTVVKFLFFKPENPLKSAINIPIFLYFLIAAISVAFSYYLFPSIKGYFKMIVYLGAYIAFLSCLKSKPSRIPIIITILSLLIGIESFYAIYQNFAGIEDLATWQDKTSVNPEQLMNRVYGTLKPYNPNLLGGYLVAGFSSLFGVFFLSLKNKNITKIILSIIGVAATLLAIVLTGSRGAYIAIAAMAFGFTLISGHLLWHDFKEQKWLKKIWLSAIIAVIIGFILLVLISPSVQHRVVSIFSLRGDSSTSYRMNVYLSTFKMFLDNWFIGIGPGNTTFRLTYGLYMVTGFDALGAYCIPLEIAAESGIFALFSFLWILFMCFARSIKSICSAVSFENKILISVCILSISGMMIHGFVDTVWYRPQIQLIFWLYVSIIAILTSNDLGNKNE